MNRSVTILVTGSQGFLGQHIARYFSIQGYHVVGIDVVSPKSVGKVYLKEYHQLSLLDNRLIDLLTNIKPSVCIHCAGGADVCASIVDPLADYYSGPQLVIKLLECIRLVIPTCLFINFSSAAVYGNPEMLPIKESHPRNPISPYGYHKLITETICSEYSKIFQIRTVNLRIFSAYGTGLKRQVIFDICKKAVIDKSLELEGTGEESRDFIHVTDIAFGIEQVINNSINAFEIFNLGSGRETTIKELSNLIIKYIKPGECKVHFTGVIPQGKPLNWIADISELNRLGFYPKISLEKGIESYVKWFRNEWKTSEALE